MIYTIYRIYKITAIPFLFFWVSWEVFHMVLCLILCIVRTSFGGDSYRVFFGWGPWEVFYTVLCLIIYIVRTSFGGENYRVFVCLGSLDGFSHGTLPDYLHRPYIFRRGQLTRFFVWVLWRVFHTVLCLIICIVRTSFGGDS